MSESNTAVTSDVKIISGKATFLDKVLELIGGTSACATFATSGSMIVDLDEIDIMGESHEEGELSIKEKFFNLLAEYDFPAQEFDKKAYIHIIDS
jgi:hypothetical protein